jgi:hypothetical protein
MTWMKSCDVRVLWQPACPATNCKWLLGKVHRQQARPREVGGFRKSFYGKGLAVMLRTSRRSVATLEYGGLRFRDRKSLQRHVPGDPWSEHPPR